MEVLNEERGAVRRLVFEGELTIYHAHALRDTLTHALAASGEVEADLAGVTDIDTAGIQVLMAAKRAAERRGRALRLLSHSPPVVALIELYDLAGWFGDPLVLTPEAEAAR
ncbi:MAG: STAS domain-containing protein [Pseudomonadota bacterium]